MQVELTHDMNYICSKQLHQATEKEMQIVMSVCKHIHLEGKSRWAPICDDGAFEFGGDVLVRSGGDDSEMKALKRMATPLNLDFLDDIKPNKKKKNVKSNTPPD